MRLMMRLAWTLSLVSLIGFGARAFATGASQSQQLKVTGFGATRADWDAAHQSAPGFEPGSAYGPMFTEDGEKVWVYGGVQAPPWSSGRIVTYEMHLPRNTSVREAKAIALKELPADAREVKTRSLRKCRLVLFTSKTLKALKVGKGKVEVGLYSEDFEKFDPGSVTSLSFGPYEGSDVGC